jgi:hypothetical protein
VSSRYLRLALIAGLAIYGLFCLSNIETCWLLDGVDLAIHETGHLVFAPFGDTIGVLGGTLFQLIVPLAFVASFWRRDRYAAMVCLWWVAQNCWHVAVYVDDARAQLLPLVGGGEHDWAYLLGEAGWLSQDHAIARLIRASGVMLYLVAIAGALLALRNANGPTGDDPPPDRPDMMLDPSAR